MKLKRSDGNYSYHCPNCKRTIAIGRVISMCIVCTDCGKRVHYDRENEEHIQIAQNFIDQAVSLAKEKNLIINLVM